MNVYRYTELISRDIYFEAESMEEALRMYEEGYVDQIDNKERDTIYTEFDEHYEEKGE